MQDEFKRTTSSNLTPQRHRGRLCVTVLGLSVSALLLACSGDPEGPPSTDAGHTDSATHDSGHPTTNDSGTVEDAGHPATDAGHPTTDAGQSHDAGTDAKDASDPQDAAKDAAHDG